MPGQELELVGGSLTVSTVSEALTKRLDQALTHSASVGHFQAMVKEDPELHAAVVEAHAVVSKLVAPMDDMVVYACLQDLLLAYGPPKFGDGQDSAVATRMWLAIYTKAFIGIPREALIEAANMYIRVGPPKFRAKAWAFPDPDVLVTYAKPFSDKINQIAWRLKKGAEVTPFKRGSEQHRADLERMRAEAAELGALRPDGTIDAAALLAGAKRAKAQQAAAAGG